MVLQEVSQQWESVFYKYSDLVPPRWHRALARIFSVSYYYSYKFIITVIYCCCRSVRPTLGRMLINIDTAMTAVYVILLFLEIRAHILF